LSVFADSSTLAKVYADEEGADEARRLELVVVSAVSRVEVPSALWRKCRDGTLSELSADLLTREFLADLGGRPGGNFELIVAMPLTAETLDRDTSFSIWRPAWYEPTDSGLWTRFSSRVPNGPGREMPDARRSRPSIAGWPVKRPKSDPAGDRNLF